MTFIHFIHDELPLVEYFFKIISFHPQNLNLKPYLDQFIGFHSHVLTKGNKFIF